MEIDQRTIARLMLAGMTLSCDTFYDSQNMVEVKVSEGRFGLESYAVSVCTSEDPWRTLTVYQGHDIEVVLGIVTTMVRG